MSAQAELERVVAVVLNELEHNYGIDGVESLGAPTIQEIAARAAAPASDLAADDPVELIVRGVKVAVWIADDGAVMVQIDTPAETDDHETMRVYMNDAKAARWSEP